MAGGPKRDSEGSDINININIKIKINISINIKICKSYVSCSPARLNIRLEPTLRRHFLW